MGTTLSNILAAALPLIAAGQQLLSQALAAHNAGDQATLDGLMARARAASDALHAADTPTT